MRTSLRSAATVVAAFVVLPITAIAQGGGHADAVTVFIGMSSATMHGDSVPGPTHKFGALAGLSYEPGRAGRLSFVPGIEFVTKGVKTLYAVNGGVVLTDVTLGYVEAPLLVGVRADPMGGLTPRVLVGPTVAVRATCAVGVQGQAGAYGCADVGGGVTTTDAGAMAAAALDFRMGGRGYSLVAAWERGLTNVVKDNDAKNRTLTLTLGATW